MHLQCVAQRGLSISRTRPYTGFQDKPMPTTSSSRWDRDSSNKELAQLQSCREGMGRGTDNTVDIHGLKRLHQPRLLPWPMQSTMRPALPTCAIPCSSRATCSARSHPRAVAPPPRPQRSARPRQQPSAAGRSTERASPGPQLWVRQRR